MTSKISFLLLFFGYISFSGLFAQSLHLTAIGQNEGETNILKTLDYQQQFNDLNSLEQETRIIAKKISILGYIESELTVLNKVNDSSFVAVFHLGQQYTKAIIHYDASLDKNLLKIISNTITENYFEIEVPKLEIALKTLNSEISNPGDPFSTLQLTNIKKEKGILYVDLKIEKNRPRTIDRKSVV